MYQHKIIPFGKYEQHVIVNEETGNSFSLVPEFGSCLLSLEIDQTAILDGYQTPEELQQNRWAKNVILLPFPNRLKDGTYSWNGNEYKFPINDTTNQTALHGFGMDKPMDLQVIELEKDHAIIACTLQYDGEDKAYPWPFNFKIIFKIDDFNRFSVEMNVQNTGTASIPFGMGWHPYFKLTEKVDELEVKLPVCEMVGIDQRMIPTGKLYEYNAFAEPKLLGTTLLDNCFKVDNNPIEARVNLNSSKGVLRYWQETGEEKFNYLQIFTPPSRSSIAIEPMTCNIDAFNNHQGLMILEKGEGRTAKFGITFTADTSIF